MDLAGFRQLSGAVSSRQAEREQTNSTVIDLGEGEVLLVDPAIEPADLAAIAGSLRAAGCRAVLGWSTHPHWDHVLWAASLGAEVPRYATATSAALCAAQKAELERSIEDSSPGHEVGLCGLLLAGPPAGGDWPAGVRVIRHDGHAPGHGALLIEKEGVLVAGDMVSDVEIPSLDLQSDDPVGSYEEALTLFESVAPDVASFVPGHGAAGDGAELARRIELDRQYLAELRAGGEISDARPRAEWLQLHHRRQLAWCRQHL